MSTNIYSNINQEQIKTKHSTIGKISLTLAILTIMYLIFLIVSLVLNISITPIFLAIGLFIVLIFPIIAIILGAIGYFGKNKDSYGLIGFILGILLIFSAIPISATAYVYVSGMIESTDSTPIIACIGGQNELLIASTDSDISWYDIKFTTNNWEATLNDYPVGTSWYKGTDIGLYGTINAGETISVYGADEIRVTMVYEPTNEIIGMWTVRDSDFSNNDAEQPPKIIASNAVSNVLREKINDERTRNHQRKFIWDQNYSELAEKHSDYMAEHNGLYYADKIDGFEVDSIMDYHISMNYVGQILAYVPTDEYIDFQGEAFYLDYDDNENISSYAIQIWLNDDEIKDILFTKGTLYAGVSASYSFDDDAYYISLLMSYDKNHEV